MIYLVDGSNVLGSLRLDRHSGEAKRQLIQIVAAGLRGSRDKAIVFFDGLRPEAFRGGAGNVSSRFSNERSADELIREEAERLARCSVVTEDRGLAAAVRRRNVLVVEAARFIARMTEGSSGSAESASDLSEWEAFFSDDKNRIN